MYYHNTFVGVFLGAFMTTTFVIILHFVPWYSTPRAVVHFFKLIYVQYAIIRACMNLMVLHTYWTKYLMLPFGNAFSSGSISYTTWRNEVKLLPLHPYMVLTLTRLNTTDNNVKDFLHLWYKSFFESLCNVSYIRACACWKILVQDHKSFPLSNLPFVHQPVQIGSPSACLSIHHVISMSYNSS